MSHWRGFLTELESLRRRLHEPALWLALALMALGALIAYGASWSWALDIGGHLPVPERCAPTAVFDAPFLSGFNPDPEFNGSASCADATLVYRWAYDDATLAIPGIGRASFSASLRVARGQSDPVVSHWQLGERPLLAVPLRSESRTYHAWLPPDDSGDLRLRMQTPRFDAPGDARPLAFAVESFGIAAVGRAWPPLSQLGWLVAIVGGAYLLVRRWGVPQRIAFVLGVTLVAILVVLLVWQRPNLTIFTPRLTALLIAAYGLTLALGPIARALARRIGVSAAGREARLVAALVALAWLIRAVGLFHPQTFMSDTGLNVNNLLGVIQGEVIFTETLPARAGGGDAPYPPAQYLLLLPFAPLLPTLRTLVISGAALADSLAILWLWLILRRAGADRVASTFAGLLYLFATPLLRSLNIGEMANVWGQALVLPWILTLLLWWQARAPDWALLAVSAIALLGHFGVFLSLLAFAASYLAILLLRRDPQLGRLTALGAGALLLVVALYYSAFPDEILHRPPAPPSETTIAQKLRQQIDELIQPAGRIGPLLTALGLGGLAVAWRQGGAARDLLLAWWISVALSWATLLISQQALRWPAFVFAAVALGGGLALGALWRRGSWLRGIAVALVALALTQGGWLWLHHLIAYR